MSELLSESHVILIVDDQPINLGVLSELLDMAGYQVLVASDGMSAISTMQYARPDLILLDIMMPEMTGFEVCEILKKHPEHKEVPVIFMSALNDVTDKVKGLSVGAVDYITKPFQQEEVLARIQLHLKLSFLMQKTVQQNATLEQMLVERTNQVNQINNTLNELKQAQLQLIQSEKMSSLGLLVAGIAHEINNPINFIYNNIYHAQEYTKTLLEVLQLYEANCLNLEPIITDKIPENELNFLREDLPKVLSSMRVGTERIRTIVLGLRNFSRIDEDIMQAADIHNGIDSTLMILYHRLKPSSDHLGIEIIKEYGKLPLVDCYLGQLNQVFMNLLANAIDAIDESLQQKKYAALSISQIHQGIIKIKTEVINHEWISISIKDNGLGMTHKIKSQIFKPFFTTKPVGKGTGIGLAMSYSIITDKHSGYLKCISEVGKGTEFIIELPIKRRG